MNYYYIWLNIPAPERHYWNAEAQHWTTLFGSATRFDSAVEAEQELNKIRELSYPGEAMLSHIQSD